MSRKEIMEPTCHRLVSSRIRLWGRKLRAGDVLKTSRGPIDSDEEKRSCLRGKSQAAMPFKWNGLAIFARGAEDGEIHQRCPEMS